MKHMLSDYLVLAVIFFSYFVTADNNIFPAGKQFTFEFSNNVFIKDFKDGKPIAYRTTGVLKVANILENDDKKLLKFSLESPQLNVRPHGSESQTEFHFHKSPLDNYKNAEFYSIWNDGNITDLYVNSDEDIALVNIKKSLVSLFQFQTKNGAFTEMRASGECKVTYKQTSQNGIRRLKQNCVVSDNKNRIVRPEKALQASTQNYRSTDYMFERSGEIEQIESRDYFHIALEANRHIGGSVDSVIVLVSDKKPTTIKAVDDKSPKEFLAKLKNYKALKVTSEQQIVEKQIDSNIKKAIKTNKEALGSSNIGMLQSAKAFLDILPVARHASKSDIVQILKSEKYTEIKPQILDILGAAQTVNTHEAVKEAISFTEDQETDNIERYLQALAIGTRPNALIITDLLKIADAKSTNEKVLQSIIHTLGSMAYRYARLPENSYASEVVINVIDYLNSSISSCDDRVVCYTTYINGLNNLQSVDTIELLLEFVNHTDRYISVAAMKALRRFPPTTWTAKHIRQFENIFFETEHRFDSSTRTLALDIILESKLTEQQLNKLLAHLKTKDRSFEAKRYVLEKLMMLSGEDAELNERVQEIIRKNRTLNNYHVLNPKGLTTALSRKFKMQPFTGTLTSIQEIFGGILKRAVVDMTIDSETDRYSYFTLGLYSGGLTSFVSSSETNQDIENAEVDEAVANAGMEITIQGSYLRPLEFFRGQGELMGHVFSGTASEPTPAYLANSLLHDHHESFQLHNGATVSVDIESALSVDLNAAIQLSLWSRNAQIQVNKNVGLALNGKIHVNAGFVTLDMNFNVENQPKLNLNTDVDFATENILCIQLSQPEEEFRYKMEKNQIIPGIKHHVQTIRKFKYNGPSLSHYLNEKNNEMCNKIFSN